MTTTTRRTIDVVANVTGDQIAADTALRDKLDSLDAVEVTMGLEEEFGIELDEEAVMQCVTVADLVKLVEARL